MSIFWFDLISFTVNGWLINYCILTNGFCILTKLQLFFSSFGLFDFCFRLKFFRIHLRLISINWFYFNFNQSKAKKCWLSCCCWYVILSNRVVICLAQSKRYRRTAFWFDLNWQELFVILNVKITKKVVQIIKMFWLTD